MPASRSASAFLLVGEDEIARSRRVAEIVDERLDAASRELNLDRLSAREADPSALATLLQTPPLLGSTRLVLLTEADAATSEVERVIGEFLRDPAPTTCLVAVGGSRVSGEPWVSFRRRGVEETFDPPKGAALGARVRDEARRAGKEIDDAAASLLVELHPDASPALLQDVAKAVAHAGPRPRVTVADVEAVTVSSPEANRYVFVELVGMGRSAEAAAELHALLEQGESPIFLVTLLTQHFLTLGGIRACEARGVRSSAEIASLIGLRYAWKLDSRNSRIRGHEPARVQARRYDREAIDRWLAGLLELDIALKSSRLPEHARMEEGVLRLMNEARAA